MSFAKKPKKISQKEEDFISGARTQMQTIEPEKPKNIKMPWDGLDPNDKRDKRGYSMRLNKFWVAGLEYIAEEKGRSLSSILLNYIYTGLAKDMGIKYKSKIKK